MNRFTRTVVLGGLTVMLAVTSCSDKAPRSQKYIELWHIQTWEETRKVIHSAVARYENANDIVGVRVSDRPNDPYKGDLARAMASHTEPDIFHTWGGGVLKEHVDAGRVADLTSLMKADDLAKRLNPGALKFTTFDGKVYAIPMDVSVVLMWYNVELFDKHAVTIPKTFEELKSACRKLRAADVTPIALGNKDKWPGAFYFIYLSARIGGRRPFEDAASRIPGGTFEHPSFIRAGHKLTDLVEVRAFDDGTSAISYNDALVAFINGKAAMMLNGTWILAHMRSRLAKSGDLAFLKKVSSFEFPSVTGGRGDPKLVVAGTNSAYAISAKCRYKEDAYRLLVEFVSATTARQWAKTGRIPALKEALVTPLLDDQSLVAARVLFRAPEVQLYYDQYLPTALGKVHKDTTQAIISGAMTPEEAAAEMEKAAARAESR